MDTQTFSELASRVLSDEPLSPGEARSLHRGLELHSEWREEFLANESVDTFLNCLAHPPSTQDEFVHATLVRLKAAGVQQQAGKQRRSPLRFAWAISAASLAAGILVSVSLWLVHGGGQGKPGAASPNGLADSRNSSPAQTGFAQLVMRDGACFDRPEPEGGRIATGARTLLRGAIELRFDKGAVVQLTGPSSFELRAPDELCLHRGEITARVPASAIGFTVSTPVSRVVDLGTEFDVRVGDAGATEALVRQGRISLRAQRAGEQPSKAVELVAGGLDRASVSLPNIVAPVLPVSTTIGDGHGSFLGLISVNGKTMEFRSPEKFREVQASVFKELRESPQTFSQQWSLRVQTSAGAGASTSIEINGKHQGVSVSSQGAASLPSPAFRSGGGKATSKPQSEAQQLLRKQLDDMRRQNSENPKIRKIIDDMLQKLDDM